LQQTLIAGQDCQVSPLGEGVPFGALVSGLTLAHLQDQAARKALFDLWIDRGVLVFRGENTSEMHVALSRVFGALERHVFKETWVDGFPELVKIKYYPDDGTLYDVDGKVLGGWLPWHSDLVYTDTINHGGILRAMQLPPTGGLTGFIDQIAAYERLPRRLQDQIEDLHVVYVMDLNAERQRYGRAKAVRFLRGARSYQRIMAREYQYPRILHPMVYRQAETGRKVLNVSPQFALGVYEMGGRPGEELLAEVVEHCIDASNAYFHPWRVGDMVLWDNWRTLHCATGVDADATRVMHRTTIAGDYALGRKLEGGGESLPRVDY
jgi:taurine dioxygenase